MEGNSTSWKRYCRARGNHALATSEHDFKEYVPSLRSLGVALRLVKFPTSSITASSSSCARLLMVTVVMVRGKLEFDGLFV